MPRPLPRFLRSLLPGLLAVLLVGCGDEPQESPPGETPTSGVTAEGEAWSLPGLPEARTEPVVRTPKQLLEALAGRLREGADLGGPVWQEDVRAVAETMWPIDPDAPAPEGASAHIQLALVARDIGLQLRGGPSVRKALETQRPLELRIHDTFLEALAGEPKGYAAWCADAGMKLLRELRDERQRALFGTGG